MNRKLQANELLVYKAAVELFLKYGYKTTTLVNIAEYAGVRLGHDFKKINVFEHMLNLCSESIYEAIDGVKDDYMLCPVAQSVLFEKIFFASVLGNESCFALYEELYKDGCLDKWESNIHKVYLMALGISDMRKLDYYTKAQSGAKKELILTHSRRLHPVIDAALIELAATVGVRLAGFRSDYIDDAVKKAVIALGEIDMSKVYVFSFHDCKEGIAL